MNKPAPTHRVRFAALVRVSTEKQEKHGESLKTQRTQITQAVEQLGGTVVGWYGGQEHATAGWEKLEVDRLLTDAAKARSGFDAVMVTHPDRWSRDNVASTTGLDVLKKRRIRFFVLGTEHDLFDASAEMFLAMSAVMGAYHAKVQKKKSLESRIHRAMRNLSACGKLPFGRTFSRETGKWGIDPDKQRIVQDVAERYIAGESIASLADEYRMNHASLHKILTRRCGPIWEQAFGSKELNMPRQRVLTDIPALLPPEIIEAVLARVAANKTYTHGKIKHEYLLSRMVFCETCGYAMFGQTNHGDRRYYRHAHTKRKTPCGVDKGWARADVLEDAVLRHLFEAFGNPRAVEQAFERAMPDLDAARQVQERVADLEDKIVKERKGRQGVLGLLERGVVTEQEAEDRLNQAMERINALEGERERLRAKAGVCPSVEEVRNTAKLVARKFRPAGTASRNRVPTAFVRAHAQANIANTHLAKMTAAEKRDLLQRVFAGGQLDGRRAGVYLEWPEGRGGKIRYTIRGLINLSDVLREAGEDSPDPEAATPARQNEVTRCASHYTTSALRARRTCRRPGRTCQ